MANPLPAPADTVWVQLSDEGDVPRREAAVRITCGAPDDASLIGGTGLFRLVETSRAQALVRQLARAGMLVRRFTQSPSWLRFGLPPDEAAERRLRAALTQ